VLSKQTPPMPSPSQIVGVPVEAVVGGGGRVACVVVGGVVAVVVVVVSIGASVGASVAAVLHSLQAFLQTSVASLVDNLTPWERGLSHMDAAVIFAHSACASWQSTSAAAGSPVVATAGVVSGDCVAAPVLPCLVPCPHSPQDLRQFACNTADSSATPKAAGFVHIAASVTNVHSSALSSAQTSSSVGAGVGAAVVVQRPQVFAHMSLTSRPNNLSVHLLV